MLSCLQGALLEAARAVQQGRAVQRCWLEGVSEWEEGKGKISQFGVVGCLMNVFLMGGGQRENGECYSVKPLFGEESVLPTGR
eukprot:2309888-Rhodomonas_salina.3